MSRSSLARRPIPVFTRTRLAEEWVVPVVTPALAARYPTVQSLKDTPFIFDDSIKFIEPPVDWTAWFTAMGEVYTPVHGSRFSQADHALDAAMAGMGVVLGRRALVVKDIGDGHLVAPFPTALATRARFSFLCPMGQETRPQIAAFRDWMSAEIAKTAHVTDAVALAKLLDD